MVVLRNLPSNIVEEAFVVIKPNKELKQRDRIEMQKKETKGKKTQSQDYVVKEAEMLISNYISSIEENRKKRNKEKLEKQYKKWKGIATVTSVLLFISIIFNFI